LLFWGITVRYTWSEEREQNNKEGNMKRCNCGKIIKNPTAKRCRACYLKSPDKGYSHNFSEQELYVRSETMKKNRIKGIIRTWNKGISMWRSRPDIVIKMKETLKGKFKNFIPKKGFFKGHSYSIKGKGSKRFLLNKHHLDLNVNNNHPSNLMFLLDGDHASLHKRAYDYLVTTGLIKNYIKWFLQNYRPRLFTAEEYNDRKN
jgi:hypothetical protein